MASSLVVRVTPRATSSPDRTEHGLHHSGVPRDDGRTLCPRGEEATGTRHIHPIARFPSIIVIGGQSIILTHSHGWRSTSPRISQASEQPQPVGRGMVLTVFAGFARELIRERTHAGAQGRPAAWRAFRPPTEADRQPGGNRTSLGDTWGASDHSCPLGSTPGREQTIMSTAGQPWAPWEHYDRPGTSDPIPAPRLGRRGSQHSRCLNQDDPPIGRECCRPGLGTAKGYRCLPRSRPVRDEGSRPWPSPYR